jgi:hypothetical protein
MIQFIRNSWAIKPVVMLLVFVAFMCLFVSLSTAQVVFVGGSDESGGGTDPSQITELPSISDYTPASDDVVPMVDISDTTESATGTSKKVTIAEILRTPHATLNFATQSISESELSEGITGLFTSYIGTNILYSTDGNFSGGVAAEGFIGGNFNGMSITGDGTLNITADKVLNWSNTGTISGTDGFTLNVGTGGTLGSAAYTATSAYQASNTLLAAIAGLSSNGIVVRTSASGSSARTITGTAGAITVTNGDGVSGNPTLTIANPVTLASPQFNPASTPFILGAGGFTANSIGTATLELDNGTTTPPKIKGYHANASNYAIASLPSVTFTNAQTTGQRLTFYRNLDESGAQLLATVELGGGNDWEFPGTVFIHDGIWMANTQITIEGSTVDTNEMILQFPNVSSDKTVTFPDATGTILLTTTDVVQGTTATAIYAGNKTAGGNGSVNLSLGTGTTTAGGNAAAIGGVNNAAQGNNSVAIGKDAFAGTGTFTRSSGGFSNGQGTGQVSEYTRVIETTNATPTELDNSGDIYCEDGVWLVDIQIVGCTADHATAASYHRRLTIKDVAATTTVLNNQTIGTDYEGNSAWNVAVTASFTSLSIQVTGAAATTIRWVADIKIVQVK